MMKISTWLLLFFSLQTYILAANSDTTKYISLKEFHSLYETSTKDIVILNFWASWCGPCVHELPVLDKFDSKENVEVVFISLDFPQDSIKAIKLLEKKNIKSRSYFLDEKNPDKMITSIDESWSGAIPATLFVHKSGAQYFHESELTEEEIEKILVELNAN